MTSTFTIDTADGRALMLTAVDGDNSVLIFPARAKAQAFVDNHPVVALHVVELTAGTIRAWVDKVQRYGAYHAILDPPAIGTMKNAGRATLGAMLAVALRNDREKRLTV